MVSDTRGGGGDAGRATGGDGSDGFASAVSCLTLLDVSWLARLGTRTSALQLRRLRTRSSSFAGVYFVTYLCQQRLNNGSCSVHSALVSARPKEARQRSSRMTKRSQIFSNVHDGVVLGHVRHQLRIRRSTRCSRSRSLRHQDCTVQSLASE